MTKAVHCAGGRPSRSTKRLPYDELLPRTSVFVTNGGYGGVQQALRHGVPVVTSGGREDKPEVGGRIAWSGVGIRLRSETPSATAVGAAVSAVLRDPRYRARAQALAGSIARSGGVERLVEIVDGLSTASTTGPGGR